MNVALAVTLLSTVAITPSPPSCRTVSYPSGSDVVQGFLCRPATEAVSPAVIVIHARTGLTDWTKFQVKRLADSGYVALAVDLFRGELPRDSLERAELARLTPPGQRERDLLAGVRFLRQQPYVHGDHIGALGYCMGGSAAFRLAIEDSLLKAAIVHYPPSFGRLAIVTDTVEFGRIRPPVLGIFGGKDAAIPVENVRAFEATMKTVGRQAEVVMYADAGHSFDTSTDPARHADVADAWRRDLAFFAAYLRRSQVPDAVPQAMLGTWKLNVAKSTWTGSIRPSQAETHVVAVRDGRVHITTGRTSASGQVLHSEWVGLFDGRDYANAGEGQTLAFTIVDDHTLDVISKVNGETSYTAKVVFSGDGKTKTIKSTAKTYSSTKVYDRQ